MFVRLSEFLWYLCLAHRNLVSPGAPCLAFFTQGSRERQRSPRGFPTSPDRQCACKLVCVWPCNPQKEGALNRANLTSQAGRKSVPSYQFGPAKVGAISRVAGWEQKIVEMRELISRFFCCPRGMPAGSGKGGKDSAISTGSADRLCCSAAVGKCQMVRKGARGKSDNRWASSSPPLSGG